MELHEAEELIRPAIPAGPGVWADLGAGAGIFTRALARIVGPGGRVVAVDREKAAVAALRAEVSEAAPGRAPIAVVEGDLTDVSTIATALGGPVDGVLLANSLHFAPDPVTVLAGLAPLLNAAGRIVVVEYDGRPANRWVPYPVPVGRLHDAATQAGLAPPRVVGERPSAYGGTMYCAVLDSGIQTRSALP